MVPAAKSAINTLIKVLVTAVTQLQVLILFPGVRSVGSVCAPSELLVSKRHPGSVQDPLGDLLVRGEVPQAVSTVAPPCSVVKDCW